MSVDCKNFTCMICMDSNTDRLENTELLGHHDPGKKARKRAKWIHGICMSCIPTLETTQHLEICPLCNKESEIKKISVTPKGILRNIQSFDISKIKNDIKNKPFIENMEKNGKILGRYLVGSGLIIPFYLYGLHIFRRIALGLRRHSTLKDDWISLLILSKITFDILINLDEGMEDNPDFWAPFFDFAKKNKLITCSLWSFLTAALGESVPEAIIIGTASFIAILSGCILQEKALNLGGSLGGSLGRLTGRAVVWLQGNERRN